MTNVFLSAVRRFIRDERATLSVEAVLVLPILLWAYGSMVVFWDAFKTQNINLKAGYTVSDMLSRLQEEAVDAAYIGGLHQMFDFLNEAEYPSRIRVSVVVQGVAADGVTPELRLRWSDVAGDAPSSPHAEIMNGAFQPHADMSQLTRHVPIMALADEVIIVETMLDYTPPLNFPLFNLDPQIYASVIATRPRFNQSICYVGIYDALCPDPG